ncbi:MAG: hypothetical protein JNM72_08780 [Deltaproteobacteria bacterium]|nr:hypothetical protein [Deltaproteobacteria bacterium]
MRPASSGTASTGGSGGRPRCGWGLCALLTLVLASAGAEAADAPAGAPPLDSAAAPFSPEDSCAAFAQLFREGYAYLDRADIATEPWLFRVQRACAGLPDPAALRSTLNRALAVFEDPHLLVTPLGPADPNVWPTAADLQLAVREDGAFVVAEVRAGSAADRAQLRPGQVIAAVDGLPLGAQVDAWLAPFVDVPRPSQRAYVATLLVNGRREGERRLGLQQGRRTRELVLENPRVLARQVAERPPLTVVREGPLLWVRFENSLGDRKTIAAFDQVIAAHLDATAVILDLRNTPSGGNTDVARSIIGHFITELRPYQVHTVPAVARATGVPRHFVEHAAPRAPHHPGRLAVLGGPWTGSMGEGLVIGLDAAANAHTFASDMGDLLGALYVEPIPGAAVEMGMEALFHVNGTPRAAYVADVPLAQAERGPNGGDPALAAARAWLGLPAVEGGAAP